MTVDILIKNIKTTPEHIEFTEVIGTIEENYDYTPARFINGIDKNSTINEAGTNEGSCKIFAFGKLNNLDKEQTLSCFGSYYREDVLGHPDNDDHANIRNFILHGWQGIQFDAEVLQLKTE